MADTMKITVGVTKHTWLDLSVSYFVLIKEQKSGELLSEEEAVQTAKSIANIIGGEYVGIKETNEIL